MCYYSSYCRVLYTCILEHTTPKTKTLKFKRAQLEKTDKIPPRFWCVTCLDIQNSFLSDGGMLVAKQCSSYVVWFTAGIVCSWWYFHLTCQKVPNKVPTTIIIPKRSVEFSPWAIEFPAEVYFYDSIRKLYMIICGIYNVCTCMRALVCSCQGYCIETKR